MAIGWQDIAFEVEPPLAEAIAAAGSWLIPERWTPIVGSKVAGIFGVGESGKVVWLDTGIGTVAEVAADRSGFEHTLSSTPVLVEEWFMPRLVERLHAAGKRAGPGYCYGFTIMPVFAEGEYEPENMFVVSLQEQLIGIAGIHRQISDLPDGTQVRPTVVE